ncbi:MAG: hypothetical protein GIW94_10985 [Candidatus Eremiobacteraeota bacterium]|nr:hypothetical protein [Candidatus Eremiobacteraeota bacterium]MBC5822075.1 hypothetical protein [Candidatus Eremiobacteraeota bacterium]
MLAVQTFFIFPGYASIAVRKRHKETGMFSHSVSGVLPQDVWAVGSYCCPGRSNTTISLIEHWNGAAWSIIPRPSNEPTYTELRGVAAISRNDVWAVGHGGVGNAYQGLTEHWDGTRWSVIPSPSGGSSLDAVAALSTNNVWAVGGLGGGVTEHWDGKRWSIIPGPVHIQNADTLTSVSAVSANDIWAVGFYDNPNNNAYAQHWDGTRWSFVPVVNGSQFLISDFRSVTAVSSNDVWAVGSKTPFNANSPQLTLVEHWNGARWSVVSSPNMGPQGHTNWLFGVTALSSTDLWAVGYWIPAGTGGGRSLFEHWNGKAWTTQPGPPALESPRNPREGNYLYGGITAVGPGLLWAVGNQDPGQQGVCCERTLIVGTTHG